MIMLAAALQAAMPGPPPKAAAPGDPIGEIILAPVFRSPFVCSQHALGELDYAGDALGSDCLVIGGVENQKGAARLYRTDGLLNEDWYGWHADVISPIPGTVAFVFENLRTNVPGTMGPPPAGTVRIRTADGTIIVLGHVAGIMVKVGDKITTGQKLGVDGNNGNARAPHIHIGAYREATNVPLQVRWDLRSMGSVLRPASNSAIGPRPDRQ